MDFITSEFLRGITDLKAKGIDRKKLFSLMPSFMMRAIANQNYSGNDILYDPMSISSVFDQFKNAITDNNSKILEEIKKLESERIDIPQGEFELPSNYRKRTGKFHQERINEISDLKSKLFSDELLTSFLKNSFLKFMDEHQLKIKKLMEIPRCHYKVGKYNINKEYLDISLYVYRPFVLVRNRRPPRGQHSDIFDKSDYKIKIPASVAEKVVTSFRKVSDNPKLQLRGKFALQYELGEHFFSVIKSPTISLPRRSSFQTSQRRLSQNYFSNYQYKCTKIILFEENTRNIFNEESK